MGSLNDPNLLSTPTKKQAHFTYLLFESYSHSLFCSLGVLSAYGWMNRRICLLLQLRNIPTLRIVIRVLCS